MIEHMKDNLLWLHNHWRKELRDRSKQWYVGGNRIAHRFAKKYGITPEQAAAVIAALSPQKDWFQNVSLAERIMDAVIDNSTFVWDDKMTNVLKYRTWGKNMAAAIGITPEELAATFEGQNIRDVYRTSQDPAYDMAVFARAWDEAHLPQKARIITPEGVFTRDYDKSKKEKEIALRAQSFSAITKAIEILAVKDVATISTLIGANHKVRSFYNNIIAPFAGEDVTIDTHAVAAALMRPLGSAELEVAHNFGGTKKGQKGTANSKLTGLYGTYALYAEAYRRAAKDAEILPREMQSITWEAVRGMFRPEQKTKENKAEASRIWDKVAKGEINVKQAREEVSKLVGGIQDPAWVKSRAGENEASEDSSYERKLQGNGRNRGGDQPRGDGGTARPTDGVEKFSLRDATDMFDPNEVKKLGDTGFKSRYKLINMSIDDFLRLAKSGKQDSKLGEATSRVKEGVKFTSIPYLYMDREGDNLRVTGHEGRHRAMALQQAGYSTMPVEIRSYIRWSEQTDPDRFDYEENWPTRILPEEGAANKNFSIPMPFTREQSPEDYQAPSQETQPTKFSLRQQVLNMPNGAAILQRVEDTTTAREVKGHVERMIDAITPKSFSRAKLLHRYNRIGENAKRRAQKLGDQELLADVSAEAAALMSDLSSGIVAEALGMNDKIGGIPVYANGFFKVSNMNGTVKGPVAIFSELAKRNDPQIYQLYQYWSGVKRGSRFMANGTEKLFEPADIARAAALEKQFPEFVTVQKEWIAYNNGLVKLMVDTGVITPAAGKEFMKYGDYIPFYRQLEGERTVGPNIFQSIGNVKQPKKQKGESDLPLADFLETVVRNSQAAVETSMKNIAAQRAIRDSLLFQEAEKLPYKATGNNIVTVQENGLTSYYRVQDALLVEAMKGLNLPEIPMMGFIAGPANLLRNLVTKDPGFMMANLLRDSMAAYITSGTNMKPVIDTMHQFGKALAGTSPEVEALRKSGVLGGFDLSGSVDQSAEALSKKLRKNTKTLTAFEKGTSPVTGIWDALEKGSAASDAATRAAVYKRVMEETGNEAEALFKALEVMNFNRRGNSPIVRILTAAIPFLNARMQGMDLLYRATTGQMNMANAKQIQKTFFIRAATMMGLSLMYYGLVSDDDEFKKQEQEVKDNNWLVPALGIRIPIPHEIGIVFKVIPERIYSLMFKSDTEKDFMNSMIRQLTTTLMVSPPQSVLPLMEMATNYSFFTGRNIVPSTIKDVEAKYQTLTNTSTLAKTIGESLGMSPVKIDHLWKGYTGTMGTYLVDVVDSVMNLHADVPKASKRFEQMPVIKRFALDPDATGKISAYYELKDSTDEVIRTINFLEKNQKFSEMAEYQKDHLNILATEDYVKEIAKSYKELDEFRAFVVSSKMGEDAKRDALLNISKMKSNMVSNVQELKKRMSQYGS